MINTIRSPSNRLALLVLVLGVCAVIGGQQTEAADALGGIGNLIGGVTNAVTDLTGTALSTGAGTLGLARLGVQNGAAASAQVANGAAASAGAAAAGAAAASGAGGARNSGLLGGVIPGVLNSAGNVVNGVTRPVMGLLGSLGNNGLIGDTMRLTSGAINGLTSTAAAGIGLAGQSGLAMAANQNLLHNQGKREAVYSGLQAASEANAIENGANFAAGLGQNAAAAQLAAGATRGFGPIGDGSRLVAGMVGAAAGAVPHVAQTAIDSLVGPNPIGAALAAPAAAIGAVAPLATGVASVAQQVVGRPALANEALRNSLAESALAGADMAAHGVNNARSASLASNAYRQAKLASARDRVNIAGTIQNSARISDAAIATHDAATRAEDSLLGSEVAVDSASTVLDSDGAYIPPVTSSLLRSLPYGRLGIRNIIPKPLSYPSHLLPDVWLNGAPVNYMNVPLRVLPYVYGNGLAVNPFYPNAHPLINGPYYNGQPFIANNGLLLNGLLVDPAYAYLASGGPAGLLAASRSSVLPILANGQYEALDEVAASQLNSLNQLNGFGMGATYQGYARTNPVPMITGSVSDANLLPTTNIATTYPIGSALVIEPRDSFFQDYIDNASSKQNYDERQQ